MTYNTVIFTIFRVVWKLKSKFKLTLIYIFYFREQVRDMQR